MSIRQPPPGIKDTNLRQFLQELRNAVNGVSDQVTKIIQTRSSSGGGTNPGGGGGGTDPGGGGGGGTEPPITPTIPTVVLTISPIKPLTEENFTLTATVTGDQPTGTIQFRQDGELMTLDPVALSSNVATLTDTLPKGTYTFVAEYSGDPRNLSAVSNTLTVEIGSVWDGPPDKLITLTTEPGIGYIVIRWTMPYTGDFDIVEIWVAETDTLTLDGDGNPTNATKIGESNGSMLTYVPPDMGTTYYFWGRVKDSEGLYSDFYPVGTGVSGVALSLEDEIANSQLWQDLGTRLTDGEAAVEVISGIVEGPDGLAAQYMVKTDVNGLVSGFGLYNDGEVSDFFVRADRFAVGNPAVYRGGTCSIAEHTTVEACKAAGGTWTWEDASETNIPFIVYTTAQTIDMGGGKTFTVQPGVYIKSANITLAEIGNAQIRGDLASYSWPTDAAGVPEDLAWAAPFSNTFNGWRISKDSGLEIYGGKFALYDEYGNPIIQAGKINFNQFRRLIVRASDAVFTVPKLPATEVNPTTISLTAVQANFQNAAATVSWTTNGGYSGSLPNGDELTVYPAQMTESVVTFTATSTDQDGSVFSDSYTLAKIEEGSDALFLYLSNENDSLPASSTGVLSATQVTSSVKVYRGGVEESGWTITPTITTASHNATVSPAFTAPGTVTITLSNASPDRVVTSITATKAGSATLTREITVTKQKQGTIGATGPTGATGPGGKALSFSATSYTRNKSAAGVLTPEGTTFTVTGSNLTGSPVFYFGQAGQDPFTNTWFTGTVVNGSATATLKNANDAVGGYNGYWPTGWTSISVGVIWDGLRASIRLGEVSDGATGSRGSRQFELAGYTSWTNAAAAAANTLITVTNAATTGGYLVISDTVALTSATTDIVRFYNGGSATTTAGWSSVAAKIDGNLLVTGTVGANQLAAGAITTDKLSVGVAGKNLIHNSGPARGGATDGWAAGYNSTGLTGSLGAGYSPWYPPDTGSVYVVISGTPSSGQVFDVLNARRIPVTAGQRYELSAYVSMHRITGADAAVAWYNAAGTYISENHVGYVSAPQGASGALSNWPRPAGFVTAPTNAAFATVFFRAYTSGESDPYLFVTHSYFAPAGQDQATYSAWAPAAFQTVIDGGNIRTGSIYSTNFDGNVDAPATTTGSTGWCISKNGDAVFNTVFVRTGNIVNEAVTRTGGYGGDFNSPLGYYDPDALIWAPATSGEQRGVALSSRVVLQSSDFISGYLILYRNGALLHYQYFRSAASPAQQISVPFMYYDTTAGANSYALYLSNVAVNTTFNLIRLDEYYVEFKR